VDWFLVFWLKAQQANQFCLNNKYLTIK